MKQKFLCFIVVITTLFLFVSSAKAASFKGLSVFPVDYDPQKPESSARFEYQLYPGEEITDKVRIVNKSGQDAYYKLFPADGRTTADGAFALAGEQEEKTDLGSWIKLEKDEIFVPNESEDFVSFTMKIPQNAEVGDHLGGISVYGINQEEKKEEADGIVLNIKTRVGVRIYTTVLGELNKQMEITDFSYILDKTTDNIIFNFGLKNNGNVRIEPSGDIKVYNSFLGKESASFPIDLRLVLPEKPTNVPIVWDHTPLLGKYTVRANVKYGEQLSDIVQKEIEISFITKRAKILIGLTLAVSIIIFSISIRKMTTTNIKKRK